MGAALRGLGGSARSRTAPLRLLPGTAGSRTARDTMEGLRARSPDRVDRGFFSDLRDRGGRGSQARIEKRGPGPTTNAAKGGRGQPDRRRAPSDGGKTTFG